MPDWINAKDMNPDEWNEKEKVKPDYMEWYKFHIELDNGVRLRSWFNNGIWSVEKFNPRKRVKRWKPFEKRFKEWMKK